MGRPTLPFARKITQFVWVGLTAKEYGVLLERVRRVSGIKSRAAIFREAFRAGVEGRAPRWSKRVRRRRV